MKHLFVSLASFLVVALSVSTARADKCGTNDRVPLPPCAKTGRILGSQAGNWVQNDCSYPITVKFDKPGSDARKDVAPKSRVEVDSKNPFETKVSCCPRYSQCSTPTPPLPPLPARKNLALGKPASQSSTYGGGDAARAVDNNVDGTWSKNSVTHTNNTAQSWWQVDLGAVRTIQEVVLHNRTDCCAERLSNFEIQVSNDGVTWTRAAELAGTAPTRSAYPMNLGGRYVRVQLRGTNHLSLAEVEVFGLDAAPAAPAVSPLPCNSKVMLKSSKGDYLHRPDGGNPTTWGNGAASIGNVWTLECEADKVVLKSWKGDYLHRPDSVNPSASISPNRQPWTPERSGGVLRLKSWKNDYLHRTDAAQGVDTAASGAGNDWTLEVVP